MESKRSILVMIAILVIVFVPYAFASRGVNDQLLLEIGNKIEEKRNEYLISNKMPAVPSPSSEDKCGQVCFTLKPSCPGGCACLPKITVLIGVCV